MELRVVQPRATRDVDLTCLARARHTGEYLTQTILSELRRLADLPMDDHFVFRIGEAKHDLENAPYGGARYPVTAMLAGRPFIQFQLDVGADSVVATPERLPGKGWLGFCGLPTPIFTAISIEQQFAEKIHAYTLPRSAGQNTRVKDLVDLVLLVRLKTLIPEELRRTLLAVFSLRRTHSIPTELTAPPDSWITPFADLAAECGLSMTVEEAFSEIAEVHRIAVLAAQEAEPVLR